MKKIKILHVVHKINIGGVETFLMNLLRNIDHNHYELVFLCAGPNQLYYEEEILKLGGRIINIPEMKKWNKYRFIRDFQNMFEYEAPDIVHIHTYFKSIYPLIAAKRAGIAIRIVHSHDSDGLKRTGSAIRYLLYTLLKFPLNHYSTVKLACSEAAGRSLFYSWKHFEVVENGISLEEYKFSKQKRSVLRGELSIPNNAIVIGSIGRLSEVKNYPFLINVFDEFLKTQPKAYLLLVGDGALRSQLEDLAQQLGIENKVIITGLKQNANDYYNAMDIFILPSLSEGLSMVLIEAQANGLRCITSTGVPPESNIAGLVTYLKLSKGTTYWTKKIAASSTKRTDTSAILENSPYDIRNSVHKIEDIYKSLYFDNLKAIKNIRANAK